jgi:hypothetical protein
MFFPLVDSRWMHGGSFRQRWSGWCAISDVRGSCLRLSVSPVRVVVVRSSGNPVHKVTRVSKKISSHCSDDLRALTKQQFPDRLSSRSCEYIPRPFLIDRRVDHARTSQDLAKPVCSFLPIVDRRVHRARTSRGLCKSGDLPNGAVEWAASRATRFCVHLRTPVSIIPIHSCSLRSPFTLIAAWSPSPFPSSPANSSRPSHTITTSSRAFHLDPCAT